MKVLAQFLLAISLLSAFSVNQSTDFDFDEQKIQQVSSVEISSLVKKLIEAESLPKIQSIIAENQQLVSTELIAAILQAKEIDPLTNLPKKTEAINRALLGLAQRVNHRKGLAVAINNLGFIYTDLKKYDLAIEYHNYCVPILTKLGDKIWLSKTHRLLGRVYYIQRNYFAAQNQYALNLALAKEIGNPYYLALAYLSLGTAYEENGLFNEAIQEYNKSLAISQTVTNPPPDGNLPSLIGSALLRSGRAYLGSSQLDKAIKSYQQNVDHWRQIPESPDQLSSALNSLGYASFEAKLYQQAIEASTKSREIAEKSNAIAKARKNELLALSSRVIALAHSAMGNHAEAIKTIAEAKQFAPKANLKDTLRIVYRVEGIVYEAAKQPELARVAFEKAIELTEQQQAHVTVALENGPSSMGYPSSSYSRMIALMVSQKRPNEALRYSEMLKSRALFNLLTNPQNKDTGLISTENLKERQQLTAQILKLEMEISKQQFAKLPDIAVIAQLQSRLDESTESLKNLLKKIDQQQLNTSQNSLKSTNLTKQDLKKSLRNDQTALLQFAIGEEQTFLFVATKSADEVDLQAYTLNLNQDQIASKVKNFRNLITGQNQTDELGIAARDLHNKLLDAAQSQLKNKSELIIVPDGPLWELPFQALKTPENRYLIEQAAISYIPSFSILQIESARLPNPAFDLLAFGNPSLAKRKSQTASNVLMGQPLEDLPDASKLVNDIRRFYHSKTSRVLTGPMATEESFKSLAAKYRIIHLAAHGFFNDKDPMGSGIVLAQPGVRMPGQTQAGQDGFLQAREIIRIKLKAEMVVLSACESGRGQMRSGEGIVGLPWAIFVAGCPTTVVSQWEVDSKGTADLMSSMYSHLNQNNKQTNKAEALQKAAISMLKSPNRDFHHPFYWAGFILFGKTN